MSSLLSRWKNSMKKESKEALRYFGLGYRKGVNDFTREIENEYSDKVVFLDKKIIIKRDFWEKLKLEMFKNDE